MTDVSGLVYVCLIGVLLTTTIILIIQRQAYHSSCSIGRELALNMGGHGFEPQSGLTKTWK